MIEILEGTKREVLAIRMSGVVTKKDYDDVLVPRFDKIIERFGGGRLLIVVAGDFEGFEVESIMADAKFGLVEGGFHVEKLAVVGADGWFARGIRFAALFMHGDVHTFEPDRIEEAWAWLKEPIEHEEKQIKNAPAVLDI